MKQEIADVCVVGLGYIGLPTAIVAAQAGFRVVGYDIDKARIAAIASGSIPDIEPQLLRALVDVQSSNMLSVQDQPIQARYFIIAVPTPCTDDKRANLYAVEHAIEAIIPYLHKKSVIIIESTVPVGTTRRLAQRVAALTKYTIGTDLFIAFCPERILPGNMFWELIHNPRTIGGITPACSEQAGKWYAHFVKGELSLLEASAAELVKLVENSYRDVQLAFAHQVADMATAAGVDPYELIAQANKHPRVHILRPTCGVGGHCIAVDPWFLIETNKPQDTHLLRAARTVNDARPHTIAQRIADAYRTARLAGPIALLGATYKANVDDMRESPALAVAQVLQNEFSHQVVVHDPYVNTENLAAQGVSPVTFDYVLHKSDLVACLVAHKQFVDNWQLIALHPQIIDYCGIKNMSMPTARTMTTQHQPIT